MKYELMKTRNNKVNLSEEQREFIAVALNGGNILVDACIGSGKTTAIQHLCDLLPQDKKILYLTYNKLLKLDAKNKIKNKNVLVTNYHGLAWLFLKQNGLSAGVSDMIQMVINKVARIPKYDILIIDEYQDIEQELADFLQMIKNANPTMQIIAVGDMEQKIYDKTTLKVPHFINDFLGEYERLEFTKCFRLSNELASVLGRIWSKKIDGVNDNCTVEEMTLNEVVEYLKELEPRDILCLGARNGDMSDVLNILEEKYPETFNKNTVYASIADTDRGSVDPKPTSAIFTTYDSSKGLERKICVIFDFTESYWSVRVNKPQTSYEILRNIFCVAASRGKEKIIFVKNDEAMLSEKSLATPVEQNLKFDDMDISKMFDFKYKEDIEQCFDSLEVKRIVQEDDSVISISSKDGLIDLSPCIGIYQEASYFRNYSIDAAIQLKLIVLDKMYLYTDAVKKSLLDEKILFLTALETNQNRYKNQVEIPFVSNEQREQIRERLSSRFAEDVAAQVECQIDFSDTKSGLCIFSAVGYADVVIDNVVYELKFVSEVTHEHFLQCACYMAAMKMKKGILWNTRDNSMYSIKIKSMKKFMDSISKAITKGAIQKYYEPIVKGKSITSQMKKG